MNRDELILSCEDTVKNLVRKYNNHKPDEDLQAVGMTSVIECVDRSLDEGLTDVDQVQARCNKWARNSILDEIYREKIKYTDDNSPLEYLEAEEDLWETIVAIKTTLSPRECDVFELLLNGDEIEEICKKLNITKPTYYEHFRNMKKKIQNTTHNFDVF
jgi:RNA polymerase sigma factor (sigma-70 family)